MRSLASVSTPIIRNATAKQPYARRRVNAVQSTLTCLVLYRHQETGTQLFVSDDGDAVGAVWIEKQPVLVDPRFPGPFLVVTMTRTDAQRHGFTTCILDWSKYTPEEQCQLKDAVEAAYRARQRYSGRQERCATHHGRNAFA